eukprot:scpid110095/ scgid7118/ 
MDCHNWLAFLSTSRSVVYMEYHTSENKSYTHRRDPVIEHINANESVAEHPSPGSNVSAARDTVMYFRRKHPSTGREDQDVVDFTILCDRFIEHRRADIFLVDEPSRPATDLAVPVDPSVAKRKLVIVPSINFFLT